MKILIACEFSGIVRDAFIAQGHNAISCDLLPTERPGPHMQDDILKHLNEDWDMMIAFPPCTHLAVSGARYFKDKHHEQQEAIEFFMKLVNAPIPKIAIENPVGIMSTKYRKPDQIIQPWMFGEDASKKTCLWLKGLPKLKPTKIIEASHHGVPMWQKCQCCDEYWCNIHNQHAFECECPEIEYWTDDPYTKKIKMVYANQCPSGQNKLAPSEHRAMDRSRTYQGIAQAMAEQWSNTRTIGDY